MPLHHSTEQTKIHGTLRCLVFTLLAAGSLMASASASALQPPQFYEAGVGGSVYGGDGGHFGSSDSGASPVGESSVGAYWEARALASEIAGGTVSVKTSINSPPSADPSFVHDLTATAGLAYRFTLDGPLTDSKIPVLFLASGAIFADLNTGTANEVLTLGSFEDGSLANYSLNAADFPGEQGTHSFSVHEIYYITPGSALLLNMSVYSKVTYPGIADGKSNSSYAAVDPTFTILGGYADSYHFVGLPESAIAPVPEPASWILLVGGFGVMGALARRRRFQHPPIRGAV